MTCIVGLVDEKNKRVVIGADSASVGSNTIYQIKDGIKLFKRGTFLFGCAGDFRLMQIIKYSLVLPKIKHKDILQYLVTDFASALMETYEKSGSLIKYDDGQRKGSAVLIGYKNRLFEMDFDFHFSESLSGINAIGCGSEFAYGAMDVLKDIKDLTSDEKVLKALEASEKYSTGVVRPFVIDST